VYSTAEIEALARRLKAPSVRLPLNDNPEGIEVFGCEICGAKVSVKRPENFNGVVTCLCPFDGHTLRAAAGSGGPAGLNHSVGHGVKGGARVWWWRVVAHWIAELFTKSSAKRKQEGKVAA
jgi:hypothetical protein